MLDLTLRNSSLKSELQQSQEELRSTRKYLLNSITQDDHKQYKNVALTKLIDILKQSMMPSSSSSQSIPPHNEHLPSIRIKGPKLDNTAPDTLRAPASASNITTDVETDSRRAASAESILEGKLEKAESRFKTTQRRCWALERENKTKKETIDHWKRKTEEVSKHCERLMFHLKQETAAKATAIFRADGVQTKLKKTKKKIVSMGKEKDQVVFKMTLLKQGAEILEGQLRSLDARFIQLRGTLDWQVHHSRGEIMECSREFVRLSSQIEEYRKNWNDAEDRVRRLDYDVKHLRSIKMAGQRTVKEEDEVSPSQEGSRMVSSEEEGEEDKEDEKDEKDKAKSSKKSSKKKKSSQKGTQKEDPTWRYETVSTSGADPLPDW